MRDAQRTFFWYHTTIIPTKPKKVKRIFRNPIIQAKEMSLEMELNDLTKADLARKLGISRARVTQMLNLLKLPKELIEEIEAMGDYWGRRVITERMLRSRLTEVDNLYLDNR
ncbi:MAG: hypothetical protein KAH31_09320 [Candidatus Sabulitectum sp.]|nr:hypothetical protein [Candidatus Sabulitectum sp.]